ncbi:glycosyltransferase family 2 protein [Paenibacillus sp. HW567]|uniref:glycosyltransferase family 2 protein n=1 Tax=Paenibacillus sp. HW567 TaxID=1034769 RepID=UPI0003602C42|nr:glycosyltransferase [Paenibacillus sp. HW567]
MEIWYIESRLSQKLPQPFEDWLCEHAHKIFVQDGVLKRKWFDSKDMVVFSNLIPSDIELNEDFSCSLNLSNTIIEQRKFNKEPVCILINNNNRALPYFLVQNFWCKHPALITATIVTIQNSINPSSFNASLYRFPEYWVNRKNQFSIDASHFILTWDRTVRDVLQKSMNVLYIEKDNDVKIDLDRYIEKNIRNQNVEYPINSSIPSMKWKNIGIDEKGGLSVIIPFYNMGSMILETIHSVTESTYNEIEIIIVNDGSDDVESIDVLRKIESSMPFVRVLHITNGGLSNARNVGAHAAKSDFITFLDSDDLIAPEYYQRCITILESYRNVSFVYSWVRFFGLREDVWVTFDTELPLLLLTNMLSAFAVIKKEHFLKYGINKLEMEKGMEDHESWINMSENGCAGISIPEALVYYRIRNNSMSRQFNREIVNDLYYKISQFHIEIYKQYGNEIFNLLYMNGPGYMWNNPAVSYPELGYSQDQEIDNNLKYELMRIFNTKKGKLLIKLFLKLNLNRWFK